MLLCPPLRKSESVMRPVGVRPLTASHRYLGSVFPDVLKQPNVEYRQANLTVSGMSSRHHVVVAGTEPSLPSLISDRRLVF